MDISNINNTVLEILKKRGISDQKDIEEFLSDKPQRTYDPFLLHNMKEGVDFLLDSIEKKERICIYGDYDVDGITATALLYNFLSHLTDNLMYYIPSRFDEGYGLNLDSVTQLREEGVDLLITVDCGAVSKDEIEHAKNIGMKVIITDHHNMEAHTTPDCVVINPKHQDSKYPFPELCGCAVAFKLVQAIVRTKGLDKSHLVRPLDLIAIATVADVVPLIDENRTMVKYGLKELNRGTRKAFRIMMNKLNIKPGTVDSYKIGFVIGPHINAVGRMDDANKVVKMLTIDDNEEINCIMDTLIEHNKQRKTVQEKCFDECVEMIEEIYINSPFIVVKPTFIHEGIAGIVAGRIREMYNRPAIVLSETEDSDGEISLKGSGRSIDGIDLIKLLVSHKELFSKLGGHAMAAGFSMPKGNEEKLREALISETARKLEKNPSLFDDTIIEDMDLNEDDIDIKLVKSLELMAPFGVKNPRPVFLLNNIKVVNKRYMGNDNQHVKFNSGRFDCILFGNASENEDILKDGESVCLYGNPSINQWQGKENVQFLIKAVKKPGGIDC